MQKSKKIIGMVKDNGMAKGLKITAGAIVAASLMNIAFSGKALAMVAPAAGSFLYSLYDYGVIQGVQGAPGFVGGVGLIVAGAVNVMKHPLLGVPALFAGICLTQAPAIVTSMGMMI